MTTKKSSKPKSGNDEQPSSPAPGSGEDETVFGVKIAVVDKGRLARCIAELKLKVPKGAGVEELVEVLASHFTTEHKAGKEMLECDRCDGVAPEAMDVCPFCGEPSGGSSAESGSSVIGGNSEADPPSVMEAAHRTETALAKVERSALTTTSKATVVERAPREHTEEELEDALSRLQQLKRSFAENTWQIGQQVIRLTRESKGSPALWRLKKGPDGVKALYKDFKAFLRGEVGFSFRMAENCAYLTEHYTEEKLSLVSTSKMEIVLNAPPKERDRLIASGAAAGPVRELRAKVRELNIAQGKALKAEGKVDPTEKRREARQERAKKEEAKKDDAKGVVTFTLPGKKGKVWLYRRNKDAKGKLIPAHSLTDNHGWIEGVNGVRLVFSVSKEANGQIRLTYEARRESEEG